MEGEVLGGRYELRGVLGRGGMAEVRDGWDTRLNRAAAIRLLHPTLTAQPDMRRRFEDEARSVAALGHHPNIVAVYDYGDHNSTPFIVMERLRGLTLGDETLVARCRPTGYTPCLLTYWSPWRQRTRPGYCTVISSRATSFCPPPDTR